MACVCDACFAYSNWRGLRGYTNSSISYIISFNFLSILFNSEWVTILVTRSPEMDGFCFIEVEVSFPVCAIEPTPSSSSAKQKEARVFTCALIAHLNYLLRLQDYGFTLGIISTEGIWSAVIEIEKALEVPFFETIIPP